jgi:hypothetical protein
MDQLERAVRNGARAPSPGAATSTSSSRSVTTVDRREALVAAHDDRRGADLRLDDVDSFQVLD